MSTQNILPDKYRGVSDQELEKRIAEAKKRLVGRLTILGHYYQRDEVIKFADAQGDSFALAKAGAAAKSDFIVFCGVHFMAESSVILARKGQRVFLPDMDAGCPLADMAGIEEVGDAWMMLEGAGIANDFLPVAYINSSAEIKAFCGEKGGTICTSSSAAAAFKWAMDKGKRIFFLPDENLGRNTALSLKIKDREVARWDPFAGSMQIGEFNLANARVIVWKGYCHVHTYFTTEHVVKVRAANPGCKVAVHPECSPEVVAVADGCGSTAYLKKFAEDAPKGATVVIGTEINLVSRLAREHPEKKILPLARSLCPNMFKISLADLCWTLEEMGKVNEVFVETETAAKARIALDRMLAL